MLSGGGGPLSPPLPPTLSPDGGARVTRLGEGLDVVRAAAVLQPSPEGAKDGGDEEESARHLDLRLVLPRRQQPDGEASRLDAQHDPLVCRPLRRKLSGEVRELGGAAGRAGRETSAGRPWRGRCSPASCSRP